jgi:hypothetical protein
MNAYVYRADLHCEDCARDIMARLPKPADVDNEASFDSDDYPKGPYSEGDGESDTPSHCGSCGLFLQNPLTDDGRQYVMGANRAEWDAFYGINHEVTQ